MGYATGPDPAAAGWITGSPLRRWKWISNWPPATTPADWQDGDDVVIIPSLQDPKELEQRFPKGFKAVRPYLRVTPQPNR